MSIEQQEHEVMQLVSKMDKLTRYLSRGSIDYHFINYVVLKYFNIIFFSREGVIQPCKIGDDGRPKPIEHVLQLQEEIMSHFNNIKNKDDPDDKSD